MKKILLCALLSLSLLPAMAQKAKSFVGTLENKEWNLFIRMNLEQCNVTIPGQELFGETCGYLGDHKDPRVWIFISGKAGKRKASLTIVNDYGSEDLKADLVQLNDSTYELRQQEGSRIKIVRNRHYTKIPKTLEFKRK